MSGEETLLLWVDLETTGLEKESGRILEYAAVLTDLDLYEFDSVTGVIPQKVKIARVMMDDYVTNMHTNNGLLEELEALEINTPQYGDTVEQAEQSILDLTTPYNGNDRILVISGNTVGFDKGWIEKDMPRLFKELHYRQLDVSSYKVGFPELFGTKTSDAHRAMDDIRASIGQQVRMRMIVAAGVKALKAQGVLLGV